MEDNNESLSDCELKPALDLKRIPIRKYNVTSNLPRVIFLQVDLVVLSLESSMMLPGMLGFISPLSGSLFDLGRTQKLHSVSEKA